MRLIKLNVCGREFPAAVSLSVVKSATEKYGSLDAIFRPEENEIQTLDKLIWFYSALLQAGQKVAREQMEEAPEPPTQAQLMDLWGLDDLVALEDAAKAVIIESSRPTVEIVEQDPKNAKARSSI